MPSEDYILSAHGTEQSKPQEKSGSHGGWSRTAGKAMSAALFVSMWAVPPSIDRAGYRSTIGTPVHLGHGFLPLYTGSLTPANLAFLVLYTAWLEWTANIVNPRHYLRLHTAAKWIAPVIAGIFFSPICYQVFLCFVAFKGTAEYRQILALEYRRASSAHAATHAIPGAMREGSMHGGAGVQGDHEKQEAGPRVSGMVHCSCAGLVAASGMIGLRMLGAAAMLSLSLLILSTWNLMRVRAYNGMHQGERHTQGGRGNEARKGTHPEVRRVLALDLLCILYIAVPLGLCNLMLFSRYGKGWMLLLISCSWIGDGGAYFIGGRYGRHKCCPCVSPGKSWEGVAAEFGFCVVTCLFLRWLKHSYGLVWINLPPLSPLQCVCLGAYLTFGGVTGDLCESLLKRLAGLKDSGDFFPGHGGILDRFDGIFFIVILQNLRLLLWPQ